MIAAQKKNPRHVLAMYDGKRKHISQMSKEEQRTIWKRLRAIPAHTWRLHGHALDRLKQKKINATYDDIVSAIHHAEIIEYKVNYLPRKDCYDERVILKSKAVVNRCYNMKIVYSLTNRVIVSIWINHVNDLHATLDMSLYTDSIQVFKGF